MNKVVPCTECRAKHRPYLYTDGRSRLDPSPRKAVPVGVALLSRCSAWSGHKKGPVLDSFLSFLSRAIKSNPRLSPCLTLLLVKKKKSCMQGFLVIPSHLLYSAGCAAKITLGIVNLYTQNLPYPRNSAPKARSNRKEYLHRLPKKPPPPRLSILLSPPVILVIPLSRGNQGKRPLYLFTSNDRFCVDNRYSMQ